jgi:hypothetical protein
MLVNSTGSIIQIHDQENVYQSLSATKSSIASTLVTIILQTPDVQPALCNCEQILVRRRVVVSHSLKEMIDAQ